MESKEAEIPVSMVDLQQLSLVFETLKLQILKHFKYSPNLCFSFHAIKVLGCQWLALLFFFNSNGVTRCFKRCCFDVALWPAFGPFLGTLLRVTQRF